MPDGPKASETFSIVIPTYNRPQQLIASLEILIPQCIKFDCRILVIDNASDLPVADLIQSHFGHDLEILSIFRSNANIGGNSNLCRCFELCETTWMWLLGDDDTPYPNAIETIYSHIEAAENSCGLVNFSSALSKTSKISHIRNFQDLAYCAKQDRWFSNFQFISTSLYRIPYVKPFISHGYHFSYSCAPHLILPTLALAKGHTIWNSDSFLVDWKEAPQDEKWNMIYVILGLTVLTDHPDLRVLNASVGRSAIKMYVGETYNWTKICTKKLFICPKQDLAFWASAYCRIAGSLGFLDKLVLILLSFFAQALQYLDPLRALVLRIMGWKPESENISRT